MSLYLILANNVYLPFFFSCSCRRDNRGRRAALPSDSSIAARDPSQIQPPCPLYNGTMELQASMGLLGAEGDCGMLSLLVPSPQSEAVTHELEELTLQPKVKLLPLNERKNGKPPSPQGQCFPLECRHGRV